MKCRTRSKNPSRYARRPHILSTRTFKGPNHGPPPPASLPPPKNKTGLIKIRYRVFCTSNKKSAHAELQKASCETFRQSSINQNRSLLLRRIKVAPKTRCRLPKYHRTHATLALVCQSIVYPQPTPQTFFNHHLSD